MIAEREILLRQTPDNALKLAHEIIKEEYRGSLYLTAKDLLGFGEVTKYTHQEICRILESGTKRKLICVPRGTFKSSLGVVSYSIWSIIRNPNIRILIDSALYTNSKNFIREIKAHLETEKITSIFGQFRSDNNWSEGSITVKQRTRPIKEGTVTASGIGASKVSQHYDLIIMDDMNTDSNSNTQEGRQKVIDHYRMNTSILEPEGVMVIIGTRYSENDLIGHILRTEVNPDDGNGTTP